MPAPTQGQRSLGVPMTSNTMTHLLDAAGEQLCDQPGPVAPVTAMFRGTKANPKPTLVCPTCARAAVGTFVRSIHGQCGGAMPQDGQAASAMQLLDAMLCLATTPQGEEAVVMLILGTALGHLDMYMDDGGPPCP